MQIAFSMTEAMKCDRYSLYHSPCPPLPLSHADGKRAGDGGQYKRRGMTEHSLMGPPERFPTVLIVDDDVDILQLCAVKLMAAGYRVLQAVGSAEAHRICESYPEKIDLILLDVMLYPPSVQLDSPKNMIPRLHGDKLLPILRAKRPLSRLMLMSACSPWKLGGRGMGGLLRQYPFLQKPFMGDTLIDKVRETLNAPVPTKPSYST